MKRQALIAALAILAVIVLAPTGLATANAHDGPVVLAVLHDSPHSHGGVSAGGNPPAIMLPATVQLDELLVMDTNYSEEVRSDALRRGGERGDNSNQESEPRARDVRRSYARG